MTRYNQVLGGDIQRVRQSDGASLFVTPHHRKLSTIDTAKPGMTIFADHSYFCVAFHLTYDRAEWWEVAIFHSDGDGNIFLPERDISDLKPMAPSVQV